MTEVKQVEMTESQKAEIAAAVQSAQAVVEQAGVEQKEPLLVRGAWTLVENKDKLIAGGVAIAAFIAGAAIFGDGAVGVPVLGQVRSAEEQLPPVSNQPPAELTSGDSAVPF